MKRLIPFMTVVLAIVLNTSTMAQSEFSGNQISVGVVVTDLERSLDFYLHVIGMTKVDEFEVDEAFARSSGLSGGVPFHVDVLKLADSPTIMVNSLEPFLERIREYGVRLLGDTPIELGDQHFVLVQDPDGTFIELIGPLVQE
jgi:catechol 2,3-dioxygenase-like lactoylglutathione lyase family enzyme